MKNGSHSARRTSVLKGFGWGVVFLSAPHSSGSCTQRFPVFFAPQEIPVPCDRFGNDEELKMSSHACSTQAAESTTSEKKLIPPEKCPQFWWAMLKNS
ncbi:hypothetical protein TNIN_172651 [Trichonephila inaurata madagascariensis]|uniref:Uncharacterized protein n=1 Tax=Trichonephila inaurata madagascariensis TaxID=2747483 RepID=A0A8X6MA79_9ARAC|nr:hypothetical protein TNIN_172651 [Trichonephila inaurata madagascariensis]